MAINVGDKVRFTKKFKACVGMGPDKRTWKVLGIVLEHGWAIVDERTDLEYYQISEAELAADPTLAFRRIALSNLETCK